MKTWRATPPLLLSALLLAPLGLSAGCGDKDGGDDTSASGDDTSAGGDDTSAGGDDTSAGGDDTAAANEIVYSGSFVMDADELNTGGADSCVGTATITFSDGAINGEASCDFSGIFSKFGTTSGLIEGQADLKTGVVTATFDTDPAPIYADMTGVITDETLELNFESDLQYGTLEVALVGVITTTQQ